MIDMMLSTYWWLPIIILLIICIWLRYTFSFGKRSQRALAQRIESLQRETSVPLFVCTYAHEGYGILVLDNEGVRFLNATAEMFKLRKDEIINVEYSDLGFCHIVTATNRYKLAYIHHAKDAKGVFTMTFGPEWRDDDAIKTFVSTLEQTGLPHAKVDHSTLLFWPLNKI